MVLELGLREAKGVLWVVILLENHQFRACVLVGGTAQKGLRENVAVLLAIHSPFNVMKPAGTFPRDAPPHHHASATMLDRLINISVLPLLSGSPAAPVSPI